MSSKQTDPGLVDVNKRDKEAAVNKYKDFKKKIREIVDSDEGRSQVLKELGLGE